MPDLSTIAQSPHHRRESADTSAPVDPEALWPEVRLKYAQLATDPTATPEILIQGTHGADDPEKATLPYIVGDVAATAHRGTGPRGIASDDLVDGVTIVTAANLAEALADGARSVAFSWGAS